MRSARCKCNFASHQRTLTTYPRRACTDYTCVHVRVTCPSPAPCVEIWMDGTHVRLPLECLSLSAADSVVVLHRKPCAAHASVHKRDATPRWSKGIQESLLLRCCSQNGLAGVGPRAGRELRSGVGCLEAIQKQVFGFPLEEKALSASLFPVGTQTV